MLANQQSYEQGLEDLKLVCDGYIEDLRRKMPCSELGEHIVECNERNVELTINNVQGVNSTSNFGEIKANTTGLDFRNYKIVRNGQFAYNPSRINLGSIALSSITRHLISPTAVNPCETCMAVIPILPRYFRLTSPMICCCISVIGLPKRCSSLKSWQQPSRTHTKSLLL